MATEASPTPISSAHRIDGVQHRASRSSLLRQESGRNSPATRHTRFGNEHISEPKTYDGDSSDDEPVPGPKFSASVKALLKGDVVEGSSPRETSAKRLSIAARDFASARPERHVRVASPHDSSTGSPAPRVVRVGSVRLPSSKPESSNSEEQSYMKDFITPAPRTRSVRITGSRSTTRSPPSNSPSHRSTNEEALSGQKSAEALSDERRSMLEDDYVPRLGASSVLRSRAGEETGMHSSLRVKRVGRLTGSFLNGPARRGVLRRQSEEVEENHQSDRHTPDRELMREHSPRYAREEHGASSRLARTTSSPKLSWIDSDPRILEKPAPAAPRVVDMPFSRPASPKSSRSRSTPGTTEGSEKSEGASEQPQYRVPPPALPSTQDQENDPPPTFKRVKPSGLSLLDKPEKYAVIYDDDNKERELPPATVSPRKPLTSRSNNTPRTMAPPPPKMSVLETATATGGAATTASQSRKKRSQVTINHKAFTRMDCIGRGGTSRVYRVMAENYKIFALKRVSLEDVDRVTLAGYKGEIDLLKRLENVDRVVRLFDWEINMEKHTLSVLMEIGESDLEKILTYRLNAEDAVFDFSFTRFYWKEMLECVQAVHKYNIVHSDLKPANFLLVQGRLKLIDFGIANAISDDTVNVHREQQVGTPNYMSPEALIDSNAASGLPASVGKMMKLGKPSDIWSLGCILYKMVYGQPPFARIAKYYERLMAIPNPKVPIEFPQFAIGGKTVPPGLLRTMKRCLQRDQTLRPTTEELLSDRDPFLYPEAQLEGTVPVTQEMIARILTNVVNHCRVRGVPKEEELAGWPAGFFTKIKAAVEEEHK